jgi:hypothetical protein
MKNKFKYKATELNTSTQRTAAIPLFYIKRITLNSPSVFNNSYLRYYSKITTKL